MNVSRGDIAIITGKSINVGCIGEVVRFYGNIFNKADDRLMQRVWLLKFSRPIKGANITDGKKQESYQLLVSDDLLKRLAGPSVLREMEGEYERE